MRARPCFVVYIGIVGLAIAGAGQIINSKRGGEMKSKVALLWVLLVMPAMASADFLDVIEVKLKEGCTFAEYLAIKDDFNSKWAAKYGYRAEVIMPVQSHNLVSLYWVGRTADAATFGKAWDHWRDGLSDPDSMPAKLWARFSACSTNISRRGYDVY